MHNGSVAFRTSVWTLYCVCSPTLISRQYGFLVRTSNNVHLRSIVDDGMDVVSCAYKHWWRCVRGVTDTGGAGGAVCGSDGHWWRWVREVTSVSAKILREVTTELWRWVPARKPPSGLQTVCASRSVIWCETAATVTIQNVQRWDSSTRDVIGMRVLLG